MRPLWLLALASWLFAATGCGYALVGQGSSFPAGVTRVAVTSFKNRTVQYNLEAEATSAFVSRLQSTGKVTVVDRGEADATLEGVLTVYKSNPVAYNAKREVTERRVVVTAAVTFLVKGAPKPFFSEDGITGRADFAVSTSPAENTQREQEAGRKALADLAEKVVSRIAEGF